MNSERLRLTLTALWLGLMVSFSLVTAPAAFSVLPEQRLAGAVVSRTLAITESTGIVIGLILLISLINSWRKEAEVDRVGLAMVGLMTTSMLVARFYVARSLHEIRVVVAGEINSLAADDPMRLKFNLLHRASVWLMGGAIIGALVIITRAIRSGDSARPSIKIAEGLE